MRSPDDLEFKQCILEAVLKPAEFLKDPNKMQDLSEACECLKVTVDIELSTKISVAAYATGRPFALQPSESSPQLRVRALSQQLIKFAVDVVAADARQPEANPSLTADDLKKLFPFMSTSLSEVVVATIGSLDNASLRHQIWQVFAPTFARGLQELLGNALSGDSPTLLENALKACGANVPDVIVFNNVDAIEEANLNVSHGEIATTPQISDFYGRSSSPRDLMSEIAFEEALLLQGYTSLYNDYREFFSCSLSEDIVCRYLAEDTEYVYELTLDGIDCTEILDIDDYDDYGMNEPSKNLRDFLEAVDLEGDELVKCCRKLKDKASMAEIIAAANRLSAIDITPTLEKVASLLHESAEAKATKTLL